MREESVLPQNIQEPRLGSRFQQALAFLGASDVRGGQRAHQRAISRRAWCTRTSASVSRAQ